MYKFTNSIAGIIIISAAVMAASCSGGTGIDTANPGTETVDQAAIIEQAITSEEMPSLDKMSSGWEQWTGSDILIDWYTVWLNKHQSVDYGLNELDETKLIAKAEGVYNFEDDGKDYLNFPAAGGGLKYAVFGLKDVPEGAIMRGIRFTTDFNSSESPNAEYYVCYSNYENGVYQWYGPFAEGEYEVYNLYTDNINEYNRGYFTIAVTGNNYFSDVTDVEVIIGDPVRIDLPLLYEFQPIPNWWIKNDLGYVDWSKLFELPDVQELKIRPDLEFRRQLIR
ncbi:MAG: hypothetical protein R3F46_03070 [bacterium]